MNFLEGATERAHQAAGTAADFERGVAALEALQLRQQLLHGGRGGGEELVVGLLAAAEGHVVIGVFAGAPIPIGAHASEQVGFIHVAVVILTFMALAFRRVTRRAAAEFRCRRAGWRGDRRHRRAGFGQSATAAARGGNRVACVGVDGSGRARSRWCSFGANARATGRVRTREGRVGIRRLTARRQNGLSHFARRRTVAPPGRRSLVARPRTPGGPRRSRAGAHSLPKAHRRSSTRVG